MNIKQNIAAPFGPFTARGFNKIADKVNEKTQNDVSSNSYKSSSIFIAIITSYVVIIANRRWKYGWSEAEQYINGSVTQFQLKGGSTITHLTATNQTAYAYNTVESLQQSSGAFNGPGLTNVNIPGGFSLQPIAVGTCVLMHRSYNATDGSQAFSFTVSNAIDGVCA